MGLDLPEVVVYRVEPTVANFTAGFAELQRRLMATSLRVDWAGFPIDARRRSLGSGVDTREAR